MPLRLLVAALLALPFCLAARADTFQQFALNPTFSNGEWLASYSVIPFVSGWMIYSNKQGAKTAKQRTTVPGGFIPAHG